MMEVTEWIMTGLYYSLLIISHIRGGGGYTDHNILW